jgi:hypothetical protein
VAAVLPKVFIGSSTESSIFAEALQANLKNTAEVLPWMQLEFPLSKSTMEALETAISESDFAVFVLHGDDSSNIRDITYTSVRDNVLIELGMSIGMLGRDRTYITKSITSEKTLRIPSDLAGLSTADFESDKYDPKKANANQVMGPASSTIRTAILKLGLRPKLANNISRRIQGVLGRGSTDSISTLADAGIHVADNRHEYLRHLKRAIFSREIIPSKYLYWSPHGSAHWLDICARETYIFYRSSLTQLRKVADQLAKKLIEAAGTAAIDLVSVGSGDGIKDNMLLRALSKHLQEFEYIYYYPVDISDALIARAAPQALGSGLRPHQFRLKALVSDYAELPALARFYEERPNPNLFSVLGNTIGNSEEQIIFGALDRSLLEGDLVLVEINVGSPNLTDPILRERANLQHDFSPLAAFNVPFEAERIKHSIIVDQSIIPNTKSILTEYSGAVIEEISVESTKLAIVHYYDLEEFRAFMEQRLSVRIISQYLSNGVALLLAKRTD